jgi:hypothetical protein
MGHGLPVHTSLTSDEHRFIIVTCVRQRPQKEQEAFAS